MTEPEAPTAAMRFPDDDDVRLVEDLVALHRDHTRVADDESARRRGRLHGEGDGDRLTRGSSSTPSSFLSDFAASLSFASFLPSFFFSASAFFFSSAANFRTSASVADGSCWPSVQVSVFPPSAQPEVRSPRLAQSAHRHRAVLDRNLRRLLRHQVRKRRDVDVVPRRERHPAPVGGRHQLAHGREAAGDASCPCRRGAARPGRSWGRRRLLGRLELGHPHALAVGAPVGPRMKSQASGRADRGDQVRDRRRPHRSSTTSK